MVEQVIHRRNYFTTKKATKINDILHYLMTCSTQHAYRAEMKSTRRTHILLYYQGHLYLYEHKTGLIAFAQNYYIWKERTIVQTQRRVSATTLVWMGHIIKINRKTFQEEKDKYFVITVTQMVMIFTPIAP